MKKLIMLSIVLIGCCNSFATRGFTPVSENINEEDRIQVIINAFHRAIRQNNIARVSELLSEYSNNLSQEIDRSGYLTNPRISSAMKDVLRRHSSAVLNK